MASTQHRSEVGKRHGGVSHSTLGSDRCNRLLYRGGVDLFWIDALHRPFSLWICRHEGANWRHRQLSKWAVDGSDCTQSNGCRGWFLRWKTIFDPRSRSVVHREFLTTLGTVGIESVKLPPRSPNLNAYAERFVRTIKESCLEQMIFFGEEGLRNAVREFVTHYHLERNHQGLDNRLIIPTKTTMNATARPHASIFWTIRGAVIRRPPGKEAPKARLEARGTDAEVNWMVNGRFIGRQDATQAPDGRVCRSRPV